jgi:hypothetical protein
MYNACFYNVKCEGGISQRIISSSGMKQGCNLSPALSNLYQNDLHDIFDASCNPVELNGHSFNSLSWADDLVLVSTSQSGLQNALNALQQYCYRWAIGINPNKSSCMIMSKGKCKNNITFIIDGQELNNANFVSYLGFYITHNMSHTAMIEDRVLKANRATFFLKQAISLEGTIKYKYNTCHNPI